MQPKHLFEYAIIRVVPRVEREEFLNAGAIVFCKKPAFLQTQVLLDEDRLLALHPGADIEEIKSHLQAYERISRGDPSAGPIALLDLPSRFRWLTAKRSTIIQSSAVHPGLCEDADSTVKRLLEQFVLQS